MGIKISERVKIVAVIIAIVLILGAYGMKSFIVGYNDDQNYQILQSPGGTVSVNDEAGWYGLWFSSVWTYPRSVQEYFSASTKEG